VPDKHVTDEEIWESSGHAPRVPPGVPRATCLNCLSEHVAFYAQQAHDCRIELAKRDKYLNWLDLFRRLGIGVLKDSDGAKFEIDEEISGRTALTFHLQSDLDLGPDPVLDPDYYDRLFTISGTV